MILCDLFEKRTPLIELLEPYRDDPDVFVSFTDILKMGVNPKTDWDDPIGIYAYPVSEMFSTYHGNNIPFAGERKYAFILRANGKMLELTQMGEDEVERDIETMVAKFREAFYQPLPSELDSTREDCKEYFEGILEEWHWMLSPPGPGFWRISERMASFISNRFPNRERAMIWNSLLRSCGYDGVVDRGAGIISDNEPAQALFLSISSFEVLGAGPNDLFRSMDREIFNRRFHS